MTDADGDGLKVRTARTLKWNVIDRVTTQVLYGVTGIVLARELTQTDFGLVGAVLVFQAFASLLVDSGFSYALLQRKLPTRLDYSSVLWFNLAVASGLYVALWFAAPLLAACFENDARLIPLSRVMFISLILNASAMVQTSRFMKQMNVRPVALANTAGLAAGSVVGIWMACTGWGAWAIVWQTITLATVKSLILWVVSGWLPLLAMSWRSLRSFMSVGTSMLATSALNTVFLNIYSFIVGNRVGLTALGYYTQSDKWSKMGTASLSAVLTSSFLPALSAVQDDAPRFANLTRKMNRLTAYLTFPAMLVLAVLAAPIFHTLFGVKWDASIILFQLLLVRGVFTVFTSLYNNYLLSLGHAKAIVWVEVLRDGTAVVALAATLPFLAMTTPTDPVYGITLMLWGQIGAAVVAWVGTLLLAARSAGVNALAYVAETLPYLALTALAGLAAWLPCHFLANIPWLAMTTGAVAAALVYFGICYLSGSKIQADAYAYLRGRL